MATSPLSPLSCNEATPGPEAPSSALREAAYDQIDRFLRNNLDDEDYADFSQALDLIYSTEPADGVLGKDGGHP